MRRLSCAMHVQGNNRLLATGEIRPDRIELAVEDFDNVVPVFRRMARGLEWDVAEMAVTTYLTAKAHGVKFTAIPVFPWRDFHHGKIMTRPAAGVRTGKDFEGRRIGVNRGYTVTAGVWSRAILAEECGTDLSAVTWVRTGDEHVAAWVPPANVTGPEAGKTLAGLLDAGEVDGSVGAALKGPGIEQLYPDGMAAGMAALRGRGLYPINHTIVVRDEVLEDDPSVAARLVEAFVASKAAYVADLKTGAITDPTEPERLHLAVMEVLHDPLPHGIPANRAVLKTLIGHAAAQGILPGPVAVEALFAPGTQHLAG
jgi:4,5-dihydroxyphthalate decarboxylase